MITIPDSLLLQAYVVLMFNNGGAHVNIFLERERDNCLESQVLNEVANDGLQIILN